MQPLRFKIVLKADLKYTETL